MVLPVIIGHRRERYLNRRISRAACDSGADAPSMGIAALREPWVPAAPRKITCTQAVGSDDIPLSRNFQRGNDDEPPKTRTGGGLPRGRRTADRRGFKQRPQTGRQSGGP